MEDAIFYENATGTRISTERKLQLVELIILLEVKRICEKHQVKYFLVAGTLLGAVRHQGFIPWDDDIDIGMTRSEYNKFITICEKELKPPFKMISGTNDQNYIMPFIKIMMEGTTYVSKSLESAPIHLGIWIDIFPLDNVPNGRGLCTQIHKYLLKYLIDSCYVRYGYGIPNTRLRKIYRFVMTLPLHFMSDHTLLRWRDKELEKYNNIETKRKYLTGSPYKYEKSLISSSNLEKLETLRFEGEIFPVPNNYTQILKLVYGDYMTPPPESKRIGHIPVKIDLGKYEITENIQKMFQNYQR
ncbi:LicD family protein [Methanocorpusculum vombati]|uniref:LicD family protein n=1 Tax=Methanocorpusculum vombati TaxID=3002864 RepID=A0ABT4IL72_9EURY|nr:LicD family protein [Methanocorpusculum vombati]MCZ9320200.1 LicD family protein [Methanocorpusculum sp.]MCZ0861987.1 LicD family protein [Methanocorpusculum vombati]MDE2520107.1 LicD family protein [Methanocorpusculum sp.]MDE2545906.1 LicD family protein [Methanocorpusculum sp.]MDE2547444.1 LicD family protein [Methanocorpusculum sp.]